MFAAMDFSPRTLSGRTRFHGDKSQDGSVTLQPGDKLHFNYRVVIHGPNADLAKLWSDYVK